MKCQIHRLRKLQLLSVADIMSMTFIRPTKVSLELDQDLNHLVLIVVSVYQFLVLTMDVAESNMQLLQLLNKEEWT
jgi:hypothetical protein